MHGSYLKQVMLKCDGQQAQGQSDTIVEIVTMKILFHYILFTYMLNDRVFALDKYLYKSNQ